MPKSRLTLMCISAVYATVVCWYTVLLMPSVELSPGCPQVSTHCSSAWPPIPRTTSRENTCFPRSTNFFNVMTRKVREQCFCVVQITVNVLSSLDITIDGLKTNMSVHVRVSRFTSRQYCAYCVHVVPCYVRAPMCFISLLCANVFASRTQDHEYARN